MDTVPQNVSEFFTWLGSAAGFAFAMTLILERVPTWEKLPSALKTGISLVVAILLGVVSAGFTTWLPGGVKPGMGDLFKVIMGAGSIWLGSTFAHFKLHVENKPVVPTSGTTSFDGTDSSVALPPKLDPVAEGGVG